MVGRLPVCDQLPVATGDEWIPMSSPRSELIVMLGVMAS